MNTFETIIETMPLLFAELTKQPLLTRDEISFGRSSLPQKGIYVLYENNQPIYVGRSNNIKQRLTGHTRNSSDRFSATFAFRLAIKEYEHKYQKSTRGILRRDLEKDSDFQSVFVAAKSRVAKMGIKTVRIDDSITQTIFEVYAAMKLETLEYNSFDNH